MRIWRIALKFGPKIPKTSNKKTVWGIFLFLNRSPAMAFVVKGIGKFLIVKIDRKIAKQPIGISKKPHKVLKINALWLI